MMACLLLTACGAEQKASTGGLLGQASGLEETQVLLEVDGRQVPAWRYLYWLAVTCDAVAQRYEEAGAVLDWQSPVSGGTLADYVKDQALADTALYATVENWAEQYGCELTESQRTAAAQAWAEKTAQPDYQSRLARMGLDAQRGQELEAVGAEYAALSALAAQQDSALAPTKEALETFAVGDDSMTISRIFVAAGKDRTAAREKAEEIFVSLNGAENQTERFAELAAAGDDAAAVYTFRPGDGQLSQEEENAAQTLSVGECSGILETEAGFSILYRLETKNNAIVADYFDDSLKKAASAAPTVLTPAYTQLDPAAFYQTLEVLRRQEKNQESSSP